MPKIETIAIIAASILSIPLFFFVHQFYGWVCVCHVRRYCTSHGISITRWRITPAFDEKGIKTERSQIEVLSESGPRQRVFRFTVWPFGIKHVTEFNQSEDEDGA